LNLSFKKITALILCISFISGVASLAFASSDTKNKAVIEHTQTTDNTDKENNETYEKTQDDKIDYLASQFSTSFNFIKNQYYLEINNNISFLLYPPFLPPKL